ncbi:MAG: hypothetical protein KIG36_01095 [Eubacteriales bacterium]|nr:hypothetical protein [Eubacteriales bacterium]
MIVTFCGHREVSQEETVSAHLERIIEDLISEGAVLFLLGGYGRFDALAARATRKAQARHPEIQSVLVVPYPDRKYDETLYDRTVYPPLEAVPRRFAISKRNEYMVDKADAVVAYVEHAWGGAAKTAAYAARRKKRVILLSAGNSARMDESL